MQILLVMLWIGNTVDASEIRRGIHQLSLVVVYPIIYKALYGCFPKIRGKPPKWMVYNGNPY